jgi:hypothetical protein
MDDTAHLERIVATGVSLRKGLAMGIGGEKGMKRMPKKKPIRAPRKSPARVRVKRGKTSGY